MPPRGDPAESGASTLAYTRREFAGETATPILPNAVLGSPGFALMSVHVSPPSLDFHSPLFPPPAVIPHGKRWMRHIAANRMRGFAGSIARSIAPVESSTNSTCRHVLPPSVVR